MINALLHPKSIAVVGVSVEPQKVGHQIFSNLLSFKGPVYPIHPSRKHILGKQVYPDLLSIPDAIDLVIIATPASSVDAITDQCIDKKVKAVVVIAAGFAETSPSGKLLQDKIALKLKSHAIELLGPNTLGVVNTHIHLNASFASSDISSGSIGLISQSGAMLTTLFSEFEKREVGCSFALSLGNEAGVRTVDALAYAKDDPHTSVIALYLESFQDSQEFFLLCKQISKTKPIIILKGGVTKAGNSASLSHTAALATDSTLLTAASYQMGYVVVDTVEQFFETAFFISRLCAHRSSVDPSSIFPKNLMILTNAGGPAVNATDLASQVNISLATWSEQTIGRFHRELPRVKPSNPTDLLGDAGPNDIEAAVIFAQEDDAIESILLIITPQAMTDIPAITAMLIRNQHKIRSTKPLIVALMGGETQHTSLSTLRQAGITAIEYSNEGIEIYNWVERLRATQYVDRSSQLMTQLERLLLNEEKKQPLDRKRFPLLHAQLSETFILLENYGFLLPKTALVSSKKQLEELNTLDPDRVYPLIAKTANLKLKHKALVGGIVKDIRSFDDALRAYNTLVKFGPEIVLQEVIQDAHEIILGAKRDPVFGTFIAIGSGGALTNIIADRSYLFLPASRKDMLAACMRTKIFSVLTREQQNLLLLTMKNFCDLVTQHAEIKEIELNPLLISDKAIYAVDVKVQLI